jgi:hypothetical protein
MGKLTLPLSDENSMYEEKRAKIFWKILSTHVFRTSKVDEDAMEEFLFVGSGEGFGHRCAANPEYPNRENILAEGIRPNSKGALLGRRWTSIRFIRWRQTSGTNLTEISKPNALCCGGYRNASAVICPRSQCNLGWI